jgi:hypothetical protein
MPERIIYAPLERPDVEVVVDGTWWPGEVRMATELVDGTWSHSVQYRTGEGQFLGTFTDDQVRSDTIDRSRGRE